jgi:hypothetical protein
MSGKTTEISPAVFFIFLVNLVIGTGVFLNTNRLFSLLGVYSFLPYVITGLLVSPILWVTYTLSIRHKGLNMVSLFRLYFPQRASFLVALYSCAKLATAAIAMIFSSRVFASFFSYFFFDISFFWGFSFIFLLCFFLSYLDYSISRYLQFLIIFFKMIPILLTVFLLFYVFFIGFSLDIQKQFFAIPLKLASFFESISITIFAFAGFEALFSFGNYTFLSTKKVSFGRILLYGFFVSWMLYVLYQFGVGYIAAHSAVSSFDGVFGFLSLAFEKSFFFEYLIRAMSVCVFASSFGVAHGVVYAAVKNISSCCVGCSKSLVQGSVFLLLSVFALFFFDKIFLLQQLSSLGTICTYGIFVYCYIREKFDFVSFAACFSCILLLVIHFCTAFFYLGFLGYGFYFVLFFILLYLFRKQA